MDEQIRDLANQVVLSGKLATLSFDKKKKNDKDFLLVNGSVQFGEDPAETQYFRGYFNKLTKTGTESKKYLNALDWCTKAVPMTVDKDDPTFVDIFGKLVQNDYITSDGKLSEGTVIMADMFRKYTESGCRIDIEGYLKSFAEELIGTENTPTGRGRLWIVSTDYYKKALVLKKVAVPEEILKEAKVVWQEGDTAIFKIDMKLHAAPVAHKSAFGVNRDLTTGRSYLETVLVGGDDPLDANDERKLSNSVIKNLLAERGAYLKELQEKGYQGGAPKESNSSSRATVGSSRKNVSESQLSEVDEDIDDDDIPF